MCRIIGGQLVEIEDEFENSYISSVIASTGRKQILCFIKRHIMPKKGMILSFFKKGKPEFNNV
jgi:hypothetical protein